MFALLFFFVGQILFLSVSVTYFILLLYFKNKYIFFKRRNVLWGSVTEMNTYAKIYIIPISAQNQFGKLKID